MRIVRTVCAASLLCGLGLGLMSVSGGCSEPPAHVEENEQAKKAAQQRGEKMKDFRKEMEGKAKARR